ncbi:MAG: biotin/lipoyl-binding protein, partial [Burkholderiales bacterium]
MTTIEVKVPDIGDFEDVEVIEVLVKAGDRVEVEQSLITVESDKASMEIPSTLAGVVKALKVKVGDKVSEGSVLLDLDADAPRDEAPPAETVQAEAGAGVDAEVAAAPAPAPVAAATAAATAAHVASQPAAS